MNANITELFLLMIIVWLLIDDGPSCKDWWANWKAAWKEYFGNKRRANGSRAAEASEE